MALTAPYVNVLDPGWYVDPWAAYEWLRDEAPVFWDPAQKLWAISRYADIVAIEKDGGLYTSFNGSRPHIDQRDDLSMINLDDPDHQTQRNLVARRFTPRAIRNHENMVREVVTEILDAVTPLGECEAIEAIASRLPAIMIGDILGYPRDMWERVRYWSESTMYQGGQTNPNGPPHWDLTQGSVAGNEFAQMTVPVIEARRADPHDDLFSVWVAQGWDLKKILEETLLVLDGGAETTRTVIGTMIHDLAVDPAQRHLLIDDPSLLSSTAVEEFIRWVSPVLNMRRTATADHEVHGQQVRAGDELLLLYASANRDPRAFDRPDELDVTRPGNRHVAFGFGTHFCLGAHLARLEIRVTFEELLRRIPDWSLAGESKVVPATFARSYDQVPIRFTPSRTLGPDLGR